MVARSLLAIAFAAAPALAGTASHVLSDRVTDEGREIAIAAERDGACLEPAVAAPFAIVARVGCIATIRGPRDAAPAIAIGNDRIALSFPVALAIPTLPTEGRVLALVPVSSLPVGEDALAAYLISSDRGKPDSDIELHITADGARARALRWIRPGIARIELAVPVWRADIEIVVRAAGRPEVRVRVPVDPGPPATIVLDVPPLVAGAPFALHATVTTRAGTALPARAEAIGCTPSCPHAGPVAIRVAVEIADAWVAVDARTAIVAAAPSAPTAPSPWQWIAVARGGADLANGRRFGAAAFVARALGPVTAELGLDWDDRHARYAAVAPVAAPLALSEHAIGLLAGARYARGMVAARVLAGPSLVYQAADVGASATATWALRATALATGGLRVPAGAYAIGVDVGARAAVDVIAPAWHDPAIELLVEVSLAGAL